MTMPNTSQVAQDLIDTASATGPMWEDLQIIAHVAQLANELNQCITVERMTDRATLAITVEPRGE